MQPVAILTALLSLAGSTVGQLGHHHGGFRHRANRALVHKRDPITITDTSYSVTTQFPEVVVYVDQYGNLIRTTTETVVYIPKETLLPTASSISSLAPAVVPALGSVSDQQSSWASSTSTSSILTPTYTTSTSSIVVVTPTWLPGSTSQPNAYPTQPDSPPSGGNGLHGITYSPYRGDGNCKTADEVDRDFTLFAQDYGIVRIYGVDCDQVSTVYQAAKKYGNKLFLGIYDINNIESAVSTMVDGIDHDWSIVDTVSVGNELVNNGGASLDQSLTALGTARSALKNAGYEGSVVIVDTFVTAKTHPVLCDQSDYCAVNLHAFFDQNTAAPNAGAFLRSQMQLIRNGLADPHKRIVVTETGWPWKGEPNGAAVPGLDTQSAAISSIKELFASNAADVFLFTAFNDMWKKPDPATFDAEQFWGMEGRYSPCDQ